MKPVLSLTVTCLMMTVLDIAPLGSCSDRHSSRPVKDTDIVVTLDADNISANEARLNGIAYYYSLPPYESLGQVGFELCENNNEENVLTYVVDVDADGDEVNLSKAVYDLKPDSKYMFRTFLSCSNKHTYYGIWRKFSTLKE